MATEHVDIVIEVGFDGLPLFFIANYFSVVYHDSAIEHMFYFYGRTNEMYKQKIIDTINSIEDEAILKYIYDLITGLFYSSSASSG